MSGFFGSSGGGGADITFVDKTDFVPTFPTVGGSSITGTPTVAECWYSRIGSLVFVQMAITGDLTTTAGDAYIGGLPITAVTSDKPVGNALVAGGSVLNALTYLQSSTSIKIYNSNIASGNGTLFWVSLWYRAAA